MSDGLAVSDPATVSLEVTAATAGDIVWLSLSANATLPALGMVNDEDTGVLHLAAGVYTWVFDGSDVGITTEVDAFDVLEDGHIFVESR